MKTLKRQLLRMATSQLRRRPVLGVCLLVAVLAVHYFWPEAPEAPVVTAPVGIISGRVSGVSDGDSLTLTVAEGRVKVRLYGVDAPELQQAGGREARIFLAELLDGEEARVEVLEQDQYGRSVGRVFLNDEPVDRHIIAAGQAWVYESLCRAPLCGELRALQAEAQNARRGLWRETDPQPPWVYRRSRK